MWRLSVLMTVLGLLACSGAATPEPEPEPEATAPVEAPNGRDGKHGKKKSGGRKQGEAPVVGALEQDFSGCGCGLARGSDTVFASTMSDEAWMNVDGADVALRRTSEDTHSELHKVGETATETYEAGALEATLTWKVISVCGPNQPECESIGLDAVIAVARDGRITRVDASGGCGC